VIAEFLIVKDQQQEPTDPEVFLYNMGTNGLLHADFAEYSLPID
jgi:hypothetical protein